MPMRRPKHEERGMALQFLDLTRATQHTAENTIASTIEDGPTPDVAVAPSTSAEALSPSLAAPKLSKSTNHAPTFVYTWKHQKSCIGCACVMVTSITWISMTQFARQTFTTDFQSPFFVIYFSTAWLLIHLPIYLVLIIIKGARKLAVKETLWKCLELPSSQENFHPGSVIWRCAVFTLLWNASAYMFMRAVQNLAPLHVLIVFVTSQGFVYLLSWIILHDKFIGIRTIGVILSLTGMSLITYKDGLSSKLMWGGLLALFSGVAAAAYKVLLSRLLGNISCGKIAVYHTLLGAWNIVTMWPLFLLLYFTKAEPLVWATVPWAWICASAASMLVFTSCLLYGEMLTYPILVRTGFVTAIPFCAGADILLNRLQVDAVSITASVVVTISFVLLQLPDSCHEHLTRRLKARREHAQLRRRSASASRGRARSVT